MHKSILKMMTIGIMVVCAAACGGERGATNAATPPPISILDSTTHPPSHVNTLKDAESTTGGSTSGPARSPYSARLEQALQVCAQSAPDSVCYGSGRIEVTTDADTSGFNTPGAQLALSKVRGITLRADGVDNAAWPVAVIRLRADASGTLTILAMGNTQVASLTLSNGDTPPQVQLNTITESVPSGLLIVNPTHDTPLSLRVNGADVTLASTLFAATQSQTMRVGMVRGSALVAANGGTATVLAGAMTTVALDAKGQAAAAPSESQDDLVVPFPMPHDPLDIGPIPLPPDNKPSVEAELQINFDNAIERCAVGDSKQVYRALYFARMLEAQYKRLKTPNPRWLLNQTHIKNCARFELIFDSATEGIAKIPWSNHVHAEGLYAQFDLTGALAVGGTHPLKHLSFEFNAPSVPGCSKQIHLEDGTFRLNQASLRINYNTLKVEVHAWPDIPPEKEQVVFHCPGNDLRLPLIWSSVFGLLHQDLMNGPTASYVFRDWKVTNGEVFAEAIYADRSMTLQTATIHSTSYLILRHAPLH